MIAEGVIPRPGESGRHRPWRWLLVTLACLGVHVALIWTLEEPPTRASQRAESATEVHWITDSWALEQLASLPGMHDPAVFALPALEGFSGSAWLTFRPWQPEFSGQTMDSHWLELTEERLGNVFQRFFTTNAPRVSQVSDMPLPSLLGSIPQAAEELLAPPSTVRPDNLLANRVVTPLSDLPSWPHVEVLTNSVVQVVVDADGQCLSSTLLSGCGSKAADAFAVKWAQASRFKPLRRGRGNRPATELVVCGKLTFQWQTLPLPAPGAPDGATAQP